MGMKLSPEHLKLYKAIDEILWNNWDPIGMKYNGGPRDEYESYVPSIFSLKINGADAETIASKLFEIETKEIGYDKGYENCKGVAEKIFNLNY
jgi:hypothetical protein